MIDMVMKEHRARFRGRTTPVQFFWGTFDLALTRYSGRLVEPTSRCHQTLRLRRGADLRRLVAR